MQSVSRQDIPGKRLVGPGPEVANSACHSVFEYLHKAEIKKAKDEGIMSANQLETIVHPNEYFKRSYLLKNLGKEGNGEDVSMAG